MGGAIFTNATGKLLEKKYSVGGVTVLDVVEGKFSAIDYIFKVKTKPSIF